MRQGIVKFYRTTGGWGFIRPDDGTEDVFVHISNCAEGIEELSAGQRVEFEIGSSRKGLPEAKQVRVA